MFYSKVMVDTCLFRVWRICISSGREITKFLENETVSKSPSSKLIESEVVRQRNVFIPSVEADTSSVTEVMDAQDEGSSTDHPMLVDPALVPKVTAD